MRDIVLFLVAVGCAALTAWRVMAAMRDAEGETRQLAALSAFIAHVVVTTQACGFVLRTFSPYALVGVGAGVTAITFAVVPLAVPVQSVRRSSRDRATHLWDIYGWVGPFAFVVVGILTTGLVVAFMLPPSGYDTLWYHLPSVAYWLDRDRVTTASFSAIIGRYPANIELFWLHGAAFFHTSRVVVLSNVVPTILLGFGTRALGRSLGLGRRDAALAGTLMVLTPMVLAQTVTRSVDAGTTGFVVAAAAFAAAATDAAQHGHRSLFLRLSALAGLAAGLAAGSKLTGVLPGVALVGWLSVVAARARLRHGVVLVLVVASGSFVALSSAWYIRNTVIDHNPVSPFTLNLAGVEVFHGYESPTGLSPPPASIAGLSKPVQLVRGWLFDAEYLIRPSSISGAESRGGLGPIWPFLGLPCVAYAVLRRWRSHRTRSIHSALFACSYLTAIALGQPYWWWSRFTLPVAALGAIAIPAVASTLGGRRRQCLLGATVALSIGGGLLGVATVGYDQHQWSGKLPSAIALIGEQHGFVPYARVMPNIAVFDRLGPGRVGLEDATDGFSKHPEAVLTFPMYGISLERTVVGIGAFADTETLRAWLDNQHLLAVTAAERGALAALMRNIAGYTETSNPPPGLAIFVNNKR